MKTASVSELKANLSKFMRVVKRGGSVQILERGVPVALLSGVAGTVPDRALLDTLVEAGLVRLGTGDASAVLSKRPLTLKEPLSPLLDDERRDRA